MFSSKYKTYNTERESESESESERPKRTLKFKGDNEILNFKIPDKAKPPLKFKGDNKILNYKGDNEILNFKISDKTKPTLKFKEDNEILNFKDIKLLDKARRELNKKDAKYKRDNYEKFNYEIYCPYCKRKTNINSVYLHQRGTRCLKLKKIITENNPEQEVKIIVKIDIIKKILLKYGPLEERQTREFNIITKHINNIVEDSEAPNFEIDIINDEINETTKF